MAERIWTGRDQRLMSIAIGNEVVNRCRKDGRQWTALTADELRLMRYQIYQSFHYGTSAGETRAKRATLFRMLDAGMVPLPARVVPFPAAPELLPAA